MNEVMVDLETLHNVPGGVILSIGAVFFDWRTRALGPQFYCVINRRSCHEVGLTESPDTLRWWANQSAAAREVLEQATTGGVDLKDALIGFGAWLADNCPGRDKNGLPSVNVWGNGSDFDNAFLQVACDRAGRALPWNFWRNESFRTLKNRVGKGAVEKPERTDSVAHNALDDAIHQAEHAMLLLQHLNRAEVAHVNRPLVAVKDFQPTHASVGPDGVSLCVHYTTNDGEDGVFRIPVGRP